VSELTDFVAGLPKAELHVHHIGSVSPRIVSELAERHPGTVPSDPDALRDFFTFRDFGHFVEVYLAVVALVREPEDVRMITYEIAADMATQGIRYAELTCTPYTNVKAGIPIEAFVEATEDARVAAQRDHDVRLQWVYDVPGEFGVEAAAETVSYLDAAPSSLVGFGLGGPEVGVPRPQFAPYFDAARARGLRSVPHAGETTGPQTIWDWSTSAPSGSVTAPRARRTRPCCGTSSTTGSPSRSARPPTSPRERSNGSRTTRSSRWWKPVRWSRSTATTHRCSAPGSTASTRSPPSCSTSTPRAWPSWRERQCGCPTSTRRASVTC
jgi:hypothetical protein